MCTPIFSLLKIVSTKWRINTGISASPTLSQQGNSRVFEAHSSLVWHFQQHCFKLINIRIIRMSRKQVIWKHAKFAKCA